MKYWLCEFHEQNGEAEYKHRHIYNDKQLDDIGHEGDDYDYRILNHFFYENIIKYLIHHYKIFSILFLSNKICNLVFVCYFI